MNYSAKVIADSVAFLVRLVTLEVVMPRFILAEVNTHRMFSRNSASSRAIPVETRVEQVLANPFVPEAFGVNRPGMQAESALEGAAATIARLAWLGALQAVVGFVRILVALDVHKQWANRLLEPWAWHTVVLTFTEWENAKNLRISKFAQPEARRTFEAIQAAMDASTPRELKVGEWHMPYVEASDISSLAPEIVDHYAIRISVARCAAVSYERQNTKKPIEKYIALHDSLRNNGHMSPFEHQAKVIAPADHTNEFLDTLLSDCTPPMPDSWWPPFSETWAPALDDGSGLVKDHVGSLIWRSNGYFCGNLRAPWLQYRKMLPGEAVKAADEERV